MEYAEGDSKDHLIEAIKPILPAIRMTPYGRRICSKIQGQNGTTFSPSSALSSLAPQAMPVAHSLFRPAHAIGNPQNQSYAAFNAYRPPIMHHQNLQSTASYRSAFPSAIGSPGNIFYP